MITFVIIKPFTASFAHNPKKKSQKLKSNTLQLGKQDSNWHNRTIKKTVNTGAFLHLSSLHNSCIYMHIPRSSLGQLG